MTESFRRHADDIVATFKGFLPAQVVAGIRDEHFDELSMMIESAISTSVLEHLERVSDKLGALANGIRKDAERFDSR